MSIREVFRLFLPPIYYKAKEWFSPQRDYVKDVLPPKQSKEICTDYLLEINKRSLLAFTEIKQLSRDFTFEQLDSITIGDAGPNFYGAFWVLQKYAGLPISNLPPYNIMLQHGIVYGLEDQIMPCSNKINIVWSSHIKEILLETKISSVGTYSIGAPFFYAKSLLTPEDIALEKKRLGHNLLAFPMHSTHFKDNDYELDNFIQVLKEERKRFDTVRICLYWRDFQRGTMNRFIQEGFECVCCGHMFDLLFLERQKSLIAIADATISNGVGSHIGYSVFLNKGHWLIPDDFLLTDNTYGAAEIEMEIKRTSQSYSSIKKAFMNNCDYEITNEQMSLVDDYWGISSIKSRSEMKDFLLSLYNT